ncbi:MAG TPA: protease inhibitor I42 family protein, partial [Gammaproteobacteria bacterium]|nr:protease inhibitor I42 family protein [Gammaproteobacteria bacterium]
MWNKIKYSLAIGIIFLNPVVYAETTVYTEDKPAIVLTSTQPEFVIKLKSNATTGYSWFLRKYDPHFVRPVKHVYQ